MARRLLNSAQEHRALQKAIQREFTRVDERLMGLVRRSWIQDVKLALVVSAIVLLLTGSVVLGLRWDLAVERTSLPPESSSGSSDQYPAGGVTILRDDLAAKSGHPDETEWYQLLYRITVVDFCGQQTWHVRAGYQINRNRLQLDRPISIARAAKIRSAAISLVEQEMRHGGVQNYANWCSVRGDAAASHFRSVWSQSLG